MNFIKIISLILVSTFFISCGNFPTYTSKVKKYFVNPETTVDFKDIAYDLTAPICPKIQKDDMIYISDFVNEKDLKNHSQLGFLLANQTKVNIQDEECSPKILIQDLQLATSMKLSKNGSRVLTRDINNIKVEEIDEEKKIIVGSYLITSNQIILFLKLINLNDGTTIASSTTTRLLNDEFRSLEGIQTTKEKKEQNVNNIYRPFHL